MNKKNFFFWGTGAAFRGVWLVNTIAGIASQMILYRGPELFENVEKLTIEQTQKNTIPFLKRAFRLCESYSLT